MTDVAFTDTNERLWTSLSPESVEIEPSIENFGWKIAQMRVLLCELKSAAYYSMTDYRATDVKSVLPDLQVSSQDHWCAQSSSNRCTRRHPRR